MKKRIEWEQWKNTYSVGPLRPDEDGEFEIDKDTKIIPVVPTPDGLMPIEDEHRKEIELWTGHTNFNVTSEHIKLIGSIGGVEAIRIGGRYTFRIKVGKLFKEEEVKRNIEVLIADDDVFEKDFIVENIANRKKLDVLDEDQIMSLSIIVDKAREKRPYIVAMWPNGHIDVSHKLEEILDLEEACISCGGWVESLV